MAAKNKLQIVEAAASNKPLPAGLWRSARRPVMAVVAELEDMQPEALAELQEAAQHAEDSQNSPRWQSGRDVNSLAKTTL